ncbi:MAG: TMEM175 family protein [Chloroflexota bacterium]
MPLQRRTGRRPAEPGCPPEGLQPTSDRLESFSDSVFAFAMTLLVLNLTVPSIVVGAGNGGLLAALLKQWPGYLAYLISFVTILIMWVNHYTMFAVIDRIDFPILLFNGLLLLGVTIIPFSTALLDRYLGHPGQDLATAVYCGAYFLVSLGYNLAWYHAARGHRMIAPDLDPDLVRWTTEETALGLLLYAIALPLAFLSVAASLTICVVLDVFWALPRCIRSSVWPF